MAFGNRVFRDWKKEGHGAVDLHKVIVQSCDVYFYQLGQRIGIDRIAKYARALGLGEKTGIALDDEKPGLIPDTEWKMRRFGQPWFPGETPSASIGQGYITVTPLQMANLMAAVANGGTLYRPWFVRKVESLDGTLIREYGPEKIRSLSLKENTLKHLRGALADVVNSGSGTGGSAKSNMVVIAGKTGTAQVAEMRGAYVKSEQLSYLVRDHAWFVAYAPAENPVIAVAILVEHGGHGGSAAGPLAKKVIEKYFSLQNNPPDSRQAGREQSVQIDRRLASHFDWTLFGIAIGLAMLGILTIYSATYSITEKQAGGLATKQFYWFMIGMVAMLGALTVDYHHLNR